MIKWFNGKDGYGFILYEGKDVFVHHSQLHMLADGGEAVTFDLFEGPRGLYAEDVRPYV